MKNMEQKKEKNIDKLEQNLTKYIEYEYKVVKSNDLIQKSRFQLSVQEQKIILYVISKIKPDDENFIIQNIKITEFCRICGIDYDNGKNYKNIKDTIKTLADKSIWLALENGSESLIRWINKAWIHKKSGIIKIRLDDDMKPYLLQLQERFTQYELFYTLSMRSQYSIRLYELLKSYENLHTKIFDTDDLKKLLMCENYRNFTDFQRFVLDISMREINNFSDLTIHYKTIKENKRFAKIEFTIKIKKELNEKGTVWSQIQLDEIINPDKI